MSDSDGGPGRREVAYRMFAAEYDDADFEFSESDEERAPNYVIPPTGARVNRLFVVGVLTEVESVSEDVLRARVVDPTGPFVCYAGQYQPDEQAFLERADPPLFVALTGKARTFQPDDADVIYTSLRPEAINEVDVETRDRWTLQTAEQTVERVRTAAGALALEQRGDALEEVLLANDVEEGFAAGIPLAFAHYGTTMGYLASLGEVAIDAARLVAGEVDEIDAATLPPDAAVERDPPVVPRDFDVPESLEAAAEAEPEPATDEAMEAEPAAEPVEAGGEDEGVPETDIDAEPESDRETAAGPESVSEGATDTDDESATAPEAAPEGSAAGPTDNVEAEAATTTASSDSGVAEAGADSESELSEEGVDEDETEAVGDFEPGEFDLDEEEREEIESEYGTDFQSGTEVDEPGEADIETPDFDTGVDADTGVETDAGVDEDAGAKTDSGVEEGAGGEADADPESDAGTDTEPGTESDPGTDVEPGEVDEPEDVDLEDVAVEVMEDLDDGSGAARSEVVESIVDRTGADEAAVDDAIQAALMDGRCFEPDDETLQAI